MGFSTRTPVQFPRHQELGNNGEAQWLAEPQAWLPESDFVSASGLTLVRSIPDVRVATGWDGAMHSVTEYTSRSRPVSLLGKTVHARISLREHAFKREEDPEVGTAKEFALLTGYGSPIAAAALLALTNPAESSQGVSQRLTVKHYDTEWHAPSEKCSWAAANACGRIVARSYVDVMSELLHSAREDAA